MGIPVGCRPFGLEFVPERTPGEVLKYLSLAMNHSGIDTLVNEVRFPQTM